MSKAERSARLRGPKQKSRKGTVSPGIDMDTDDSDESQLVHTSQDEDDAVNKSVQRQPSQTTAIQTSVSSSTDSSVSRAQYSSDASLESDHNTRALERAFQQQSQSSTLHQRKKRTRRRLPSEVTGSGLRFPNPDASSAKVWNRSGFAVKRQRLNRGNSAQKSHDGPSSTVSSEIIETNSGEMREVKDSFEKYCAADKGGDLLAKKGWNSDWADLKDSTGQMANKSQHNSRGLGFQNRYPPASNQSSNESTPVCFVPSGQLTDTFEDSHPPTVEEVFIEVDSDESESAPILTKKGVNSSSMPLSPKSRSKSKSRKKKKKSKRKKKERDSPVINLTEESTLAAATSATTSESTHESTVEIGGQKYEPPIDDDSDLEITGEITIENRLMERVSKIVDEQSVSDLDCQKRIQRMLTGSRDGDVLFGDEQTINLRDPYSKCLIEVPVRSKVCTHLDCFDLLTFLSKNPTFGNKCDICRKPIHSSDMLKVDSFIQRVIREIQSKHGEDHSDRIIVSLADTSTTSSYSSSSSVPSFSQTNLISWRLKPLEYANHSDGTGDDRSDSRVLAPELAELDRRVAKATRRSRGPPIAVNGEVISLLDSDDGDQSGNEPSEERIEEDKDVTPQDPEVFEGEHFIYIE